MLAWQIGSGSADIAHDGGERLTAVVAPRHRPVLAALAMAQVPLLRQLRHSQPSSVCTATDSLVPSSVLPPMLQVAPWSSE